MWIFTTHSGTRQRLALLFFIKQRPGPGELRNGTKIIRQLRGPPSGKRTWARARAQHISGEDARMGGKREPRLPARARCWHSGKFSRIPGTTADRGGRRRGPAAFVWQQSRPAAFVWQQSRPQRVPRAAFVWPRRGARTYAVAFVWPRRRARVPRVAFVWPRRGARAYAASFV